MKFTYNFADVCFNAKTKVYSDGTTNSIVCRSDIFRNPCFENRNKIEEEHSKMIFSEMEMYKIKEFAGIENIVDLSCKELNEIKKAYKENAYSKFYGNNTGVLIDYDSRLRFSVVRNDSMKRAKDSIFDYVLNNDFDYFFTGTIDPQKLDSKDPKALLKPVQNWLKDRVKRDNIQYILISEYHKKGGIHFHGLIRDEDNSLNVQDSGTKLYKGHKKPMKDSTAIKKGLLPSDGKTVYNLAKWKFGFTTCIKLFGDKLNTAFYITKYITKECKKIFGKFFWHSKKLKKPDITYSNVDFDSIPSAEFKGFKYIFKPAEGERGRGSAPKGGDPRPDILDSSHTSVANLEPQDLICDGNTLFNAVTGEVYCDDVSGREKERTDLAKKICVKIDRNKLIPKNLSSDVELKICSKINSLDSLRDSMKKFYIEKCERICGDVYFTGEVICDIQGYFKRLFKNRVFCDIQIIKAERKIDWIKEKGCNRWLNKDILYYSRRIAEYRNTIHVIDEQLIKSVEIMENVLKTSKI